MKYFFCLVNNGDLPVGSNPGRRFVYENRDKWIEKSGEDYSRYLTAGYVKGVDYVTYKGKAYWMLKSFVDLEEDFIVIVCTESLTGCDL